MVRSQTCSDAVVLVPGFIGFSRIGPFYYFSERIAAALRAALQQRLGREVVVAAACSRPIDALEVRQRFLLEQLQDLCDALPDLQRLHLVGHSTGGVDAQLLTCDRPVGERSWRTYEGVRRRIASVVAIAAPQHGTFLARSPGARFLAHPLRHRRGLGAAARLAADIIPVALRHPETGDLLSGALRQLPATAAFLRRVWEHRELIEELAPEAMAELRAQVTPEGRVPLTSFVTAAGLREGAVIDPLFRHLHELTGQHTAPEPPGLLPAIERLRAPRGVIGASWFDPRRIDARTSDGVVSTGLQLLDPSDPDEVGGIVVGDHADVLGHYDRPPALLDDAPLDAGIFHSGSGFDDRAFFALYGRVVEAIAQAIPELRDVSRPRPPLRAA